MVRGSSNLNLYPHFTSSVRDGEITLPACNFSKDSTYEEGFKTVTYVPGAGVTGTQFTEKAQVETSYIHRF